MKAKAKYTKICQYCGKEFKTHLKTGKYCSVDCFRKMPKKFSHMTLTKEEIRKMYFDEKNSIRYWFKKWGFKARNKSEAQKGKLNHKYKDGIKGNEYRAYLRDNKKCIICGYDRVVQIHHIKPRSKGGTNRINNLITLCPNCHILVHSNIIKVKSLNNIVDTNRKYKRYKP